MQNSFQLMKLLTLANFTRIKINSTLYRTNEVHQINCSGGELQTRIMFERYYSFFHCCLFPVVLSLRNVLKRFLNKPKWGAQAVVRGTQPPPPRSDSAKSSYNTYFFITQKLFKKIQSYISIKNKPCLV